MKEKAVLTRYETPLDALLSRDGGHHLEIQFHDDGSLDAVTVADARWHEVAAYDSDELPTDVRLQAEAMFQPDGVVYPEEDVCCRQ
ncbi:hypothetical protein ACIQUM_07550 [Amycolatopsis azurea]|uniref:hypothetical protein n=1 Tax=Amycolatopsis azurea TaxID=36819 RepID=UPI00381740A8